MLWKFWKKNRKTDEHKSIVSAEPTNVEINICHSKYVNLDIRRAALDWRDEHIENVELHLVSELTRLFKAMDEQIDRMSIKDLVTQKKFGKEHLGSLYNDWVEQEVEYLVKTAQKDLLAVFSHVLEYSEEGTVLNHEEKCVRYSDGVIAAVSTAAGLSVIPTVLASSVVSAGGIMGFLGATVIVWPVVAIGAVVIGGLLVLGGYKATALKSRAISRYRKGIRKVIEEKVLGYDNKKNSIRQRLQSYIDKTAKKIILEIDKCQE